MGNIKKRGHYKPKAKNITKLQKFIKKIKNGKQYKLG